MDTELKGLKKARIVAAFIDHALQVNTANWIHNQDFSDMPLGSLVGHQALSIEGRGN
jgi:hypothetical protein